MDWMGVAGVAVGAAGVGTAVVSAVFAWGANRHAQEANRLALRSQEAAKRAVGEAMEANRLGAEANDLAEGANAIAGQALDVAQDGLLEQQWAFEIQIEAGRELVRNMSNHAAREVTVAVTVDGDVVVRAEVDEVAAFADLSFDLSPTLREHRRDAALLRERRWNGCLGGQSYVQPKSDELPRVYAAHITWINSVSGLRREQVVKKRIRIREDAPSSAFQIKEI